MKKPTINFDDSENLNSQLESLLQKIDETELILLKAHLLVEFAIDTYINKRGHSSTDISEERFTFSQKIKIAEMLGLFKKDSFKVKEYVLTLNKLRNQIAHSMTYDQELLDKMCLYDEAEKNKKENKSDFLRDQLRGHSLFFSGIIVGSSDDKPSQKK